jgi:integrase
LPPSDPIQNTTNEILLSEERASNPTFALLPEAWHTLATWAEEWHILDSLILVFDATMALERPGAIGTVLHYLVRTDVLDALSLWSDESNVASLIYELAAHLSTADGILSRYQPLPEAKTARARFMGFSLERLYIFALLSTRNPYVRTEQRFHQHFERLRLWVLIHASERATQNLLYDRYLRYVADKLRLAGDGEEEWLRLAEKLTSGAQGYSAFELQIDNKAKYHLSDPELDKGARPFLQSLSHVARREFPPDAVSVNGLLSRVPLVGRPWGRSSAPILLEGIDDLDTPSLAAIIGEVDGQTIFGADVPHDATLAQQRRHASSVILASVEDNHFLPWSVNRPRPSEVRSLEVWISEALQGSDDGAQRLATAIWIALRTGRSLERTLDMAVGQGCEEEWTVSPAGLIRLPARRDSGWMPEMLSIPWIQTLALHHAIALPASISTALNRWRDEKPGASTLGELLDRRSVLSRFGHTMKPIAQRLTGGMLSRALPQALYAVTNDAIFARLFCRHPNSGLPGAAAYPSWNGGELFKILTSAGVPPISVEPSNCNALGSRLDPIESRLRVEIREAGLRLQEARRDGVVAFHNSLTSYLVVALHAATGARPVRAAFESQRDFDFKAHFVFVSDKQSGKARDGRLVPVPGVLCDYIATAYLPYLQELGRWISAAGDPALGGRVSALADRDAPVSMPLFFSLRRGGDLLSWLPINERFIAQQGLFRWPLPLRHFRHRLATQLRRHGVDPEIIDGLLGHAERGSASYSDRSARVWLEDMTGIRGILDQTFADLGFTPVALVPSSNLSALSGLRPADSTTERQNLFGRAERQANRLERIRVAVESARAIIKQTCGARDLGELDADELDSLSQTLLFTGKGLPHPLGPLRYSVLMRGLDRAQVRHPRTVRLKRIYLTFESENSQFTQEAAGALETFGRLVDALNSVVEPYDSRRAIRRSLILGVIRLVVKSRFCDRQTLVGVLTGRNYRVVGFGKHHYLEIGAETGSDIREAGADALCRRIEVDNATAGLLGAAMSSDQAINAGNRLVDSTLQPLSAELGRHFNTAKSPATVSQLIERLAELVDQVNVITLPGIVAGYLSGRVESYSLTWYDLTRLREGFSRDFSAYRVQAESLGAEVTEFDGAVLIPAKEGAPADISQAAGRKLLTEVRKVYGLLPPSGRSVGRVKRSTLATRIRELVHGAEGTAPHAARALALWVGALLTRRKRGRDQLALSAVNRYLSALSRPFTELVGDVRLDQLDEDELTELYSLVISTIPRKSQHYSRYRLQEFHAWLARQIPMEDPDWTEIPGAQRIVNANPGFFTEIEYLRAFEQMYGTQEKSGESQDALLLLLAYRFGLRGGEAFGLLRSEWFWEENLPYLRIRHNRLKNLKTERTSSRLVPLVASLTANETKFIEEHLAQLEAHVGSDVDAPIFGDIAIDRAEKARLRGRVIATLRGITGNPYITLHHARHSAANLIAARLFGIEAMNGGSGIDQESAATVSLLGSVRVTRRMLPALERYIGHGQSGTTQMYYLHLLDMWSSQLVALPPGESRQIPGVIYLDKFPPYCPVVFAKKAMAEPPSPATALMYLRLRARGYEGTVAADRLKLDGVIAIALDDALNRVAARFRFSRSSRNHLPNSLAEMPALAAMLTRISESGWDDLIAYAGQRFADSRLLPITPPLDALITTSRQVVLWEDKHFAALRSHLDWWGVKDNQLLVLATPKCSDAIIATASYYHFTPTPLAQVSPQIDLVRAGPHGEFKVEQRVALLLRETAHPIRHAAEFCICLVTGSVISRTVAEHGQ